MSVTWKKTSRFKPDVVLKRIDSFRTVNPEGGASFSGFELEELLPVLQSMLNFPEAAREINFSTLIWRGISAVGHPLTPATFLAAVNEQLSQKLATRIEVHRILTSVSIAAEEVPRTVRIEDAQIRFLRNSFSRIYDSRASLIAAQRLPIANSPDTYCKVVISVQAKSVRGAVTKALRALDLQRAFWCLMGNPRMQWISQPWVPINVVRLGSVHTVHFPDGKPTTEMVWFEPSYSETSIHRIANPVVVRKNSAWALRRIAACSYGNQIKEALLRFVRALDERDQNTAFLKLWTAVEILVSPGRADYDDFVRRCAFLFTDGQFHTQLLEHLREYRNASVHSGDESDRAKMHCFQLQLYFVNLIWFHIRNASFFNTLDEANTFLDLPPDDNSLRRRKDLLNKALKFTI